MITVIFSELHKQVCLLKSYYAYTIINQILYIVSFILLSGLFNIVTDGNFKNEEKISFLVGYITWWIAGQCIMEISSATSQDARWGTLEQIYVSGIPSTTLVFARGLVFVFYYSLQGLMMGLIIFLVYRLPFPALKLSLLIPYLLTLLGAVGLSFAFTGLHIVFKNIAVLSDAISFLFFFVSGASSPVAQNTTMYTLSRLLPLSSGIDVMRVMILDKVYITSFTIRGEVGLLIANTAIYFCVGIILLDWGFKRARLNGSLGHY